jgi:hypothetical protein
MLRLTEASVSCNNLSAVATCEHANSASSPTRLQSIGGGRKLREPGTCSPRSTFHLWLSKTFEAYSVVFIISSVISFLSYRFSSSKPKLPKVTFPESRDEIPCKVGSLSHPEISISECEPFSQMKFKFSKDFKCFHLK